MYTRRFRNDFYPFIYPELVLFDPRGFEMVAAVFRVRGREGDTESFTPSGENQGNEDTELIQSLFTDYNPDDYPLPLPRTKHITTRTYFFKFSVMSPLLTYLAINCLPNQHLVPLSIFALHIGRYIF